MRDKDPAQEWLRIATEARPHLPQPPAAEPPSAWFVTRALADRRAARTRPAPGPWFAFPGLGRAAFASAALAVACAAFVLSTGGFDAFTQPVFPDMEELDLP